MKYLFNLYDQTVFEKAAAFRSHLDSDEVQPYQAAALELRRAMVKADINYPKYHFAAPEGWINTADVVLYYKGLYHVFFQYVPTLADGRTAFGFGLNADVPNAHQTIVWGHAVSTDQIHWRDMPIAIYPDQPYDILSAKSGQYCFDENGTPKILYDGTGADWDKDMSLILAEPRDDLLVGWDKTLILDVNEQLVPEKLIDYVGTLWLEDGQYYLTTGRETEGHGAAFLLRSPDLKQWEYVDTIFERGQGSVWESPLLFRVDGKDIMLVGELKQRPLDPGEKLIYWVGRYDRETRRFIPDSMDPKRTDNGLLWAQNPFRFDGDDRWLMYGQLANQRGTSGAAPYWQCLHHIPRELYVEEGVLCQKPMQEIDSLITKTREYGALPLEAGDAVLNDTTDAFKLSFRLPRKKLNKTLTVEFRNASGRVSAMTVENTGDVTFDGDHKIKTCEMFDPLCEVSFEVYVDRCVTEIYVYSKRDGAARPVCRAMTGDKMAQWSSINAVSISGGDTLENVSVSQMGCAWD